MWVARDKSGNLYLYTEKPQRYEFKNVGGAFASLCTPFKLDNELFSELTWEDEPIEVMIDYKTKQIESLTRVFRGVALEDVVEILNDLEEKIHSKYKMIGNPYCSQNCRMVTIPHSSIQLGDNSLSEYIVDDKVVVTIYIRRNDFNNADILVSDLGGEYVDSKR